MNLILLGAPGAGKDVYKRQRYILISPSKVRVVLDTVRGKSVNDALASLAVTPKAAGEIVYKLIPVSYTHLAPPAPAASADRKHSSLPL